MTEAVLVVAFDEGSNGSSASIFKNVQNQPGKIKCL